MSVRRTRADRRATERSRIRVRGVKEVNVAVGIGELDMRREEFQSGGVGVGIGVFEIISYGTNGQD